MPKRDIHLHTARGGDIAKVDHFAPTEPFAQNTDDHSLRLDIIAANKYIRLFDQLGWIDHYICIYSIESLNDFRFWESSLNLFTQRICIANSQCPCVS